MGFKLAPGDRPLNGYTIRRGLGLGGFGEVYFAVTDSGKEVALKRIHRNLDIEFRGAQQCLNLRHPNLVGLYDIRPEDDEQGWIVMEYIAGESLKETLDRSPSGLPEEEVLQYFGQIGAAVGYLHDQGIVHRDLNRPISFLNMAWSKLATTGFPNSFRLHVELVKQKASAPFITWLQRLEKVTMARRSIFMRWESFSMKC